MKPSKPTPDFPLFPHAGGVWAKKIQGKLVYFGPWSDPDGALRKYLDHISPTPATTPAPTPATTPGVDTNLPRIRASDKPPRPRGYPLFPHSNGQWAKKVRGTTYYFGQWDQPQAALDRWLSDKDALLAGRKPNANTGGLSVDGLVNHFLDNRFSRVQSGEIKPRTFDEYKTIGQRIIKVFGRERSVADLGPSDFEDLRSDFAKTHGPVALLADITRARVFFNYGDKQFRVRPFYGTSFDKPTKAVLRAEKNRRAVRYFEAAEIRKLLKHASVPLKAMILLAINCGFGNEDVATIEIKHLDLDGGWHNYPRPKTGIVRRCPLWPETVAALRAAIATRPNPVDPKLANRVFITSKGHSWSNPGKDQPVGKEFRHLLREHGTHKLGRNFYSLRHTFQTIGDATGQVVAVQYIMGHAPASDDMAAVYRAHTFEANLLAISKHIHKWLFVDTRSRTY